VVNQLIFKNNLLQKLAVVYNLRGKHAKKTDYVK